MTSKVLTHKTEATYNLKMAPNCLECLTEDGNYSKLRIGVLLLGIFSLAFFIWLIVLTGNLNGNEEQIPGMPGWTILSESQPTCGNKIIDDNLSICNIIYALILVNMIS